METKTPLTDAYYETYNSWMEYAARNQNMPPECAEQCPIEQSPEEFARDLESKLQSSEQARKDAEEREREAQEVIKVLRRSQGDPVVTILNVLNYLKAETSRADQATRALKAAEKDARRKMTALRAPAQEQTDRDELTRINNSVCAGNNFYCPLVPYKQPGIVMVPRDPTDEMLSAGNRIRLCGHDISVTEARMIYRAMLAAAPPIPQGEKHDE